MIVPAPPPKYLRYELLVSGQQYWTPSGMGGVWTVTFSGFDYDGDCVFHYDTGESMVIDIDQVPTLIMVADRKMTLDEYLSRGGSF